MLLLKVKVIPKFESRVTSPRPTRAQNGAWTADSGHRQRARRRRWTHQRRRIASPPSDLDPTAEIRSKPESTAYIPVKTR